MKGIRDFLYLDVSVLEKETEDQKQSKRFWIYFHQVTLNYKYHSDIMG